MEIQAFIFLVFSVILLLRRTIATTFTFANNCPYTVWPGIITRDDGPQPSTTGFELAPNATFSVPVDGPWSGRFWGRTGCSLDSVGRFFCATADCETWGIHCSRVGAKPPVTIAEFTIEDGIDSYDVSLVDGFNLPLSIGPQELNRECQWTSCPGNINAVCPPELAVKGQDGSVIACKSACKAFGSPQYCCMGAYSSPQTCPPTNYSKIFKGQCPQAYSYAQDDQRSTLTCRDSLNYLIKFCP
ncbi:hypothetical protein MLD38_035628 [Melastoma candidum]|uniref:Uncharacterized protein n=1 Tax=Melastoma candidum TaxID=119954 RepID=A0ACB9LHV8_9MYRT|nr:hypothetical protein MLD38_035628 [Melastoma candidum]